MYTRHYGLYRKPFENTPDPLFLYPSKSHREVLASLRYGVDSAKGFILITGGIGTGKTTIIRALLREVDPSYLVFNIFNPKLTFDEIIKYLATKLNISVGGKDGLQVMEDLQIELRKLDRQEKRVLLMIDEAHLLPESTLEDIRLLSNIEDDNKKLIQIALVGQREIYETLRKDSLRTLKQRIVINRKLEPLSKDETKHYIRHRLRIAGRKAPLFSKDALNLIWKHSRGIPRLVNHICDNALLIGYAAGADKIGPNVIQEVISDMDFGFDEQKTSTFFNLVKFRWVGAVVLIIILVVFIAKHIVGDQGEPVNAALEKATVLAEKPDPPPPLVKKPLRDPDRHDTLLTAPGGDYTDAVPSKAEAAEPKKDLRSEQASNKESSPKDNALHVRVASDTESLETDRTLNPAPSSESTPPIVLNIPAGGNGAIPKKEPAKIIPDIIVEPKELIRKTVMPKDSLIKIAGEVYGVSNATIIDLIHMVNPTIENVDRIYAGQTILLPVIRKENLIVFFGNRYHIHYASFYLLGSAERCVAELRDQRQKSFIVTTHQQENQVFRVFYGDFKSYEETRQELNNMTLKYISFLN